MNSPAEITRIPLTIVSSVDGARTDGVLVGVLASELDEMAARVAVVRPTRDQIAEIIRTERFGWIGNPETGLVKGSVDLADALLARLDIRVVVSDSQETPDKGREE